MRARIFKAAAATAAICTLAGASLVSAQTGTIGTTGPNSNNQITSTANDSINLVNSNSANVGNDNSRVI